MAYMRMESSKRVKCVCPDGKIGDGIGDVRASISDKSADGYHCFVAYHGEGYCGSSKGDVDFFTAVFQTSEEAVTWCREKMNERKGVNNGSR